ncbi:hypothetical protein ADU59_08900 [Pararhizobium polonicum]|uniref:SH3b domain-containing protein n=1 Tax=Pararhizobium polonicum TaxID=1612624 RepID=A0A1C7P2P1_9HYPH|nr:hypothetical protein [Pararhizobium polonicum]OBZ95525.1 hypothetical protein ADU59_08900 [Pararhizobium polonicum]
MLVTGIRNFICVTLAGAGLAMTAPAVAAPKQCAIGGWSTATSADGLPVRGGPSTDALIVGRLPPFVPYEGGLHFGRGPEFEILEADNGWFRIANVGVPKIEDGDVVETVPLDVAGWISGEAIFFVIQSTKGFAEPDNRSPVVFTADDWYGPRDWLRVADCSGEWVEIAYGKPEQEKRAWFRGVCPIQETTCDGVGGDN